MSTWYLSAPAMEVNRMNLIAGSGVLSLTPVTAAVLFSEAFRHHMAQNEAVSIEPQGTLYVHHHARPFQETLFSRSGAPYHASCRITGATQFNANDKASGSKGPANSDQPLALGFAKVSLIVQVASQDLGENELLRQFQRFIQCKARFAGGEIVRHRSPQVFRDLDAAIDSIGGSGYVVTDCSDLIERELENNPANSRARALLDMALEKRFVASGQGSESEQADTSQQTHDQMDQEGGVDEGGDPVGASSSGKVERKRRSLACLGYSLLSEPKEKRNARNDLAHAYGEAMTGLVEFMPLRELHSALNAQDPPFDSHRFLWRYSWPTPDVFLVHQTETDETRC
ncbi:type I-F CRISPR-associated protein Csy2 [Halomonadaceae bacterium KBTZ08]